MVKRRREAGQTLALVSICMITFLSAAGLAVDIGYMRYERRLMQAAADSAALVAATDDNLGQLGMATAQADAQAVATANGFQDGVNGVVVSITNPGNITLGTPYAVTIQQTLPTFFMKVANINTSTVSASGVATIGTSPGCIYALQTGGAGLTLNAGINAPNCGIVDNGPLNGSGAIQAASVGVYGLNGYGGGYSPIEPIAQPVGDPLAYVAPPTPTNPCLMDPMITTGGPVTPGTYCSITISGGTANFASGLYILEGPGGLTINNAGSANLSAGGVTFYLTAGASVSFTSTGTIALSAPTAADISSSPTFQNLPPGILFYQDRNDPVTASSFSDVSNLQNGGTANLSGTLYFPAQQLIVSGSLFPNTNTPVVAQSITVNGLAMNADTTDPTLPGGSPLVNVSLVK